jgi:hypothetical protein
MILKEEDLARVDVEATSRQSIRDRSSLSASARCWPLRREEQYGLFLRDLRVTGISAGFIGGESSVCAGSAGPTL